MDLNDSKPIFLQIKHWIEDHILRGEWQADSQIPSIREMSGRFRVNTNTIVRTYEKLEADGSVYSIRGVGYFVSREAAVHILEYRREEFYKNDLPDFLNQIEVLNINREDIIELLKK